MGLDSEGQRWRFNFHSLVYLFPHSLPSPLNLGMFSLFIMLTLYYSTFMATWAHRVKRVMNRALMLSSFIADERRDEGKYWENIFAARRSHFNLPPADKRVYFEDVDFGNCFDSRVLTLRLDEVSVRDKT